MVAMESSWSTSVVSEDHIYRPLHWQKIAVTDKTTAESLYSKIQRGERGGYISDANSFDVKIRRGGTDKPGGAL